MRHPTDGTLRRLVDEPAGVADADREHVAGCPECLSALAAAQEDAALTARGAATSTSPRTWTRRGTACRTRSASSSAGAGAGGRSPAAAGGRHCAARWSPAVGVAALLAGAGAAAAADWLQIFRTERIAAGLDHPGRPRRAARPLRVRRRRGRSTSPTSTRSPTLLPPRRPPAWPCRG